MTKPKDKDLQGEGNYDATRRYDKAAQAFAKSGKVGAAARAARPDDARQAAELEQAEQAGKSHAKEEDPVLKSGGSTPPE